MFARLDDDARDFGNGLGNVEAGPKQGCVDRTGKVIWQPSL